MNKEDFELLYAEMVQLICESEKLLFNDRVVSLLDQNKFETEIDKNGTNN